MAKREPPVILLVDDEEMIITSIKSFLAIETDYDLLTYTSPLKALEDLETKIKSVDLVISDYLMPEMDGISFLAQVKKKFPLVPRILLTGYADKENAIKAINEVGLYQYIEKPWDNDGLLMVVKNGVEKRALLRALQVKIAELDHAQANLKSIQTELIKAFM